ncbi:MAG: MATE family efflux transporter, partial [Eubacteriales bacterium]|nr:MATE family efflux transporter [Eubacteriales bacterium]
MKKTDKTEQLEQQPISARTDESAAEADPVAETEASAEENPAAEGEAAAGTALGAAPATENGKTAVSQKSGKKSQDFEHGKVSHLILKQAVPLTLAQIVSLLYNIVDRIYIGHIGGGSDSTALTGVGLVFPIITLILACTSLFSYGGAPLLSIEWGKRNRERAERIEGNTFVMLFAASLAVMAFFYIFHRPVLYLFGASDRTYPYARAYLMVYLLGTVFTVVGTGMNAFISSQGFPRT